MNELTWIDIFFVLIVIDSLAALWIAWYGEGWFVKYFSMLARYFPPAKGWATLYFVLAVVLFLTAQGLLP